MTILPKKKTHPKDRYANSRSHASSVQNQSGMSPPSNTSAYPTSNQIGASGSKSFAKPPPPNLTLPGISPRSPGIDANVNLLPSSSSGYHKKGKKYAGSQSPNSMHVPNVVQPMVVNKSAVKKRPGEEANSDDEYGAGFRDDELELNFADRLKKSRGLVIKEVKGDGACMFRAVADQIYGDEEMHADVRGLCMNYIEANRDHFSQFVTEDFEAYLRRKREPDAHGNHVELQAISEIYSRPIEIYEYSIQPINIFHPISPEANVGNSNPPLRLSYHGTVHYNSVVDPYSATIGVGLGLPDFKPGHADKTLMKEAIRASEAEHIEQAMLKDKLAMTDFERTEDELAKQMERQGRPMSPRSHEDHPTTSSKAASKIKTFGLGTKRGASSPNIPSCSRDYPVPSKMQKDDTTSASMPNIGPTFGASLYNTSSSPRQCPPEPTPKSPKSEAKTTSAAHHFDEQQPGPSNPSRIGLYEELLASNLAFDDWSAESEYDETAMLAQALALSQQQYWEENKKK